MGYQGRALVCDRRQVPRRAAFMPCVLARKELPEVCIQFAARAVMSLAPIASHRGRPFAETGRCRQSSQRRCLSPRFRSYSAPHSHAVGVWRAIWMRHGFPPLSGGFLLTHIPAAQGGRESCGEGQERSGIARHTAYSNEVAAAHWGSRSGGSIPPALVASSYRRLDADAFLRR
jgi:hypothetical protein